MNNIWEKKEKNNFNDFKKNPYYNEMNNILKKIQEKKIILFLRSWFFS